MASDEKNVERMVVQKSKIDAYAAAGGEKSIEKKNENAESKHDVEMRADPPANEPIDLHCAL